MKVVALVSGGKDSCFAMMRCIDYGHQIVALANLMPADDSVDELDSYMYQTVGHQIVTSYAECMGLPLFRRRIQGSTRHQSLNYNVTEGDEVEDMFVLLSEVKRQIPSVMAVSSGAIASDYQRLRVESVCSRLDLVSLAYLWKQDQTFLLEEMIKRGIVAITIKVAAMGLNPSEHLGKELAELQSHLFQLKEDYGINVCGEGGEYETLTLDCPLFTKARILLDKFQVMLHSPDNIAPVGILHPLAFHIEYKKEAVSCDNPNNHYSLGNSSYIYEVKGDFMPNGMSECPKIDLISHPCADKSLGLSISRSRKDLFTLGCWVQNTSDTSGGLQEDLTAILRRVELQLNGDGFDWANVLYIHLYVSSMKDFALANEVYLKFITEKECHLGVPSRSTIELPLLQFGLGSAYIEVLVAKDQSKKVLHVQSISCWAPSCIGPYSQATLHKRVLYMAGQLGLDPSTMMICPGGAAIEMEQALKNCEAVANSFKSSLAYSAVLLVVYCSASLTSSGRNEVQQRMELFMQCSSDLQNLRKVSEPISLYILAPALPKGALVEVKPVLYVPGSEEDEPLSHFPPSISTKSVSQWGYRHVEWHNSCYRTYTIGGKLFVALVSITEDMAAKICNITEYTSSEGYTIKVVKFCTYILDKILLENDSVWEDMQNLKFYYTTKLALSSDFLHKVVRRVFAEFVELNERTSMETRPIFNLIPVLGCGGSVSMENIITCEIFASKL